MADLNWYRNFLAVYRLGSVSGAAKARNLTQPAVSQQLGALEASVGEPLFVRQTVWRCAKLCEVAEGRALR